MRQTQRPILDLPAWLMFASLVIGLSVPATSKAWAEEKTMTRTITVAASGRVSAEPDIVRLQAGLTTQATTARKALTDNNRVMRELIKELEREGIAEQDVQTSNFNVSPRYSRPERGGTPSINGYQVSNQVSVTVRDIERAGEILDTLVRLGANQMSGMSFEVSDADQLKDRARETAMKAARRRADLLASAAGAEVGTVISIAEDVPTHGPRPVAMRRSAMAESSVPIAAGSQELTARVVVTWQLK